MFGKGIGSIETLIGKTCEIRGNIFSKGTVRIDGHIEGNVSSGEGIIVGENAVVKGDIEAEYIIIAGHVTGDVTARSKLEILNTGRLYGDIKTPKLIIAEGVIFEGSCEMQKMSGEENKKWK